VPSVQQPFGRDALARAFEPEALALATSNPSGGAGGHHPWVPLRTTNVTIALRSGADRSQGIGPLPLTTIASERFLEQSSLLTDEAK
jgi:hypothetical protein